jgi:hypothetical protein
MISMAVLLYAIYLERLWPIQKKRPNIVFYRNRGCNDRKKNGCPNGESGIIGG